MSEFCGCKPSQTTTRKEEKVYSKRKKKDCETKY